MSKDWQEQEQARRDWMARNSLYREEDEHSSCGVGLVVNIDGKPSRKVVQSGIDALKAIWHRGAVDAAPGAERLPAASNADDASRTGSVAPAAAISARWNCSTTMSVTAMPPTVRRPGTSYSSRESSSSGFAV